MVQRCSPVAKTERGRGDKIFDGKAACGQPFPRKVEAFPVRVEKPMQHFKPLLPVQYPRRRADHLKMVEGVRFDTGKPRPRRFNVFRFNGKGEELCLDKPVVAAFKLRLQHFGVFGSDTVKVIILRGNRDTALKIFLVRMAAD